MISTWLNRQIISTVCFPLGTTGVMKKIGEMLNLWRKHRWSPEWDALVTRAAWLLKLNMWDEKQELNTHMLPLLEPVWPDCQTFLERNCTLRSQQLLGWDPVCDVHDDNYPLIVQGTNFTQFNYQSKMKKTQQKTNAFTFSSVHFWSNFHALCVLRGGTEKRYSTAGKWAGAYGWKENRERGKICLYATHGLLRQIGNLKSFQWKKKKKKIKG